MRIWSGAHLAMCDADVTLVVDIDATTPCPSRHRVVSDLFRVALEKGRAGSGGGKAGQRSCQLLSESEGRLMTRNLLRLSAGLLVTTLSWTALAQGQSSITVGLGTGPSTPSPWRFDRRAEDGFASAPMARAPDFRRLGIAAPATTMGSTRHGNPVNTFPLAERAKPSALTRGLLGSILGAGVGAIFGTIVGSQSCLSHGDDFSDPGNPRAVCMGDGGIGTLVGGAVGLVIGFPVGILVF